MSPLDYRLVLVYVAIGIASNLITGLMKPLFKMLWVKMREPSPLSLQDKVRLAQQLEMQEQRMQRLNHMAANPKDLYLYLFQLAFTSFLCISVGLYLLLAGGLDYRLKVLAALIMFVGAIGVGIGALSEASTLSNKNIEQTKAKLQNSINDARSKLKLPSDG